MRLIRRFAISSGLRSRLAGPVLVGSWLVGAGLIGPGLLGAVMVAGASPASAAAITLHNSPGASANADPSTATPGTAVTFQVFCTSLTASSARLFGGSLGLPSQIPMDRQSGGGVFSITVTLPGSIQPGVYHPAIDCSDGSSASARLNVTPFPSQGGAATGDGTTSTESNGGLAFAGLGLIGVGAVAGGIAMGKRSSRRFLKSPARARSRPRTLHLAGDLTSGISAGLWSPEG